MIDLKQHKEVLAELKAFGISQEQFTEEEFAALKKSLEDAITRKEEALTATASPIQEKWIQGALVVGLHLIVGTLNHLKNKLEGNKFELDLLVEVIQAVEVVEEIFKELARAVGATESTENLVAHGAGLLTLVLASQAIGRNLILPFKEKYSKTLDQIQTKVEAVMSSRGSDNETMESLSFYLSQAKLSLAQENSEQFQDAYRGALSVVGATPEGILKDLIMINKRTQRLWESCQAESQLYAVTGISQG